MSLQRIKHSLLRLSSEEKLIGLGSLLMILSSFMPWYSTIDIFNKKTTIENAFSGDLGVLGFIVFIISIMAALYLTGETLRVRLPYFGFKKEKIVLFLMAQGAFLTLIDIAIYTKRSFEYTNAELRFGIYLALIGATLGTLGGFAIVQKKEKNDTRAFFDHEEEGMATMDEEELAAEEPLPEKTKKNPPPENKKREPRATQINIETYAERYHTDLTSDKEEPTIEDALKASEEIPAVEEDYEEETISIEGAAEGEEDPFKNSSMMEETGNTEEMEETEEMKEKEKEKHASNFYED